MRYCILECHEFKKLLLGDIITTQRLVLPDFESVRLTLLARRVEMISRNILVYLRWDPMQQPKITN